MPVIERTVGICPVTQTPCEYKSNTSECPKKVRSYSVCEDFAVVTTGAVSDSLMNYITYKLGIQAPNICDSFEDGETKVKFPESIRGKDVFIIQGLGEKDKVTGKFHPNDRVMEVMLIAGAAKGASSGEVTAILTYLLYGRQDRKSESRVPISASIVPDALVNAGVDRIVTIDMHAEQVQGSIHRKPWDNLYPTLAIAEELETVISSNPKIRDLERAFESPDAGALRKTRYYGHIMNGSGLAIANKIRDVHKQGSIESFGLLGDVKGKLVVIPDDIWASGRTQDNAANQAKEEGAEYIIAIATHPQCLGNSYDRLTNSPIDLLVVTDTIQLDDRMASHPKILVVSMGKQIVDAICRIKARESISEQFADPHDKKS
jgi:ribose-phosphate pyrophosphokinase